MFITIKRMLITISLLTLISCVRDKSYNPYTIFFDSEDLPLLSLENLPGFWDNASLEFSNNYNRSYRSSSGFAEGIRLQSDEREVGVAVFVSQQKAIEAIEARAALASVMIYNGDSYNVLKSKWWFSDSAIFVNQWNTIIEVVSFDSDFENVKTLLMETAAEIARRIDALSN